MSKLEILQNEGFNIYREVAKFFFSKCDVRLYLLHYFVEVLQIMGTARFGKLKQKLVGVFIKKAWGVSQEGLKIKILIERVR